MRSCLDNATSDSYGMTKKEVPPCLSFLQRSGGICCLSQHYNFRGELWVSSGEPQRLPKHIAHAANLHADVP